MANRVALVTGGVGELGQAICRRLAKQGCTVAALDIAVDSENARRLQVEMNGRVRQLQLIAADVTDFESCRRAVEACEERLGAVDILVNCAGITRDATMRKMEPEQWNDVLSTNLGSVFNVTKQVVTGMSERGFGRIINIASVNGVKGQFGQSNYSAAKAGMHGFTMAVAQEVARKGVTVNTVSPGYMSTKMVMSVPPEVLEKIIAQVPVGRLGVPEEIADFVAYLASDSAGYVTGANFNINGGLHMH